MKKRIEKTLYVVSTAVFMAVMAAGCGASATKPEAENNVVQSETEAGKQSEESTGFEKVSLRLGHNNATDHFIHKASEALAQKVNERTGGAVTIEIYPAETLGTEREMIDAMVAGEGLDFYVGTTSPFTQHDDRFTFFEAPYIFESRQHLRNFYASDFMQKTLNDELAENCNVRSIGEIYYGTRHVTSNKLATTPDEFKGLKLRVPTSQIFLDTAEAMGATPTPVNFSETYLALQQGVADGQENPLASIMAMKFYEVQKYLILTGHMIQENHIFLSETTRTKLQPEVVDIILEAAKEVSDEYVQVSYDIEDGLLDELSKDMEVVEVDQELFHERMQPVYDKWIDKWGQDLMDAIDAERE